MTHHQPPKISARLDRIEERIEQLQVARIEGDIKEAKEMIERKVVGELDALRKVDDDYKKLVKRVEELEKTVVELNAKMSAAERIIPTGDTFTNFNPNEVFLRH